MDTIFLTARDIAMILKISKALAYRLIKQGQIASVRFGRTVRVRQDDLETFVRQNMLGLQSQDRAILSKEKGG